MVIPNVCAYEPAHRTAGNDIRGVVIFAGESSHADGGGQTVRHDRHNMTGAVFMGDHRGEGPDFNGVTRRKRGIESLSVEESAVTAGNIRPLTSARHLQDSHQDRG